MRSRTLNSVLIACAAMAALTACGKKDDTAYGKVVVKMSNAAAPGLFSMDSLLGSLSPVLMTTTAPDTMKIRLKYFVVGNFNETTNSWAGGAAIFVYQHAACSSVTTDPATGASYGNVKSDADCLTAMNAESDGGYIDLASSTSALNTAINAVPAKVQAASYTHFGLALLGEQQSGNNTLPNLSWTHSSVSGTQTYALKKVEYLQKFDTPLVLGAGETVTATVGYNLSNVLTTATGGTSTENTHCVTDTGGSNKSCITMPALTIAVTK